MNIQLTPRIWELASQVVSKLPLKINVINDIYFKPPGPVPPLSLDLELGPALEMIASLTWQVNNDMVRNNVNFFERNGEDYRTFVSVHSSMINMDI